VADQAPLLPDQLLDQPAEQHLPSTSSKALLQLHRKLIETESITENEKDVGEWLASYLEENGLKVEKQKVSVKRYNILAYPKSRETKVLVSSHIDTVCFDLSFLHLPANTLFFCQRMTDLPHRYRRIGRTNSKPTEQKYGDVVLLTPKPALQLKLLLFFHSSTPHPTQFLRMDYLYCLSLGKKLAEME
jgi:hypothetical protein